ncbi:MAG: hypothetical protein HDQ87_05870 [Clostridia bacterium]|nr:hypothetical protein [Clostridia bacterium]
MQNEPNNFADMIVRIGKAGCAEKSFGRNTQAEKRWASFWLSHRQRRLTGPGARQKAQQYSPGGSQGYNSKRSTQAQVRYAASLF